MITQHQIADLSVITDRPELICGIKRLNQDRLTYNVHKFTHTEVVSSSSRTADGFVVCDLATSTDDALPAVFHLTNNSKYVAAVYLLDDEIRPRSRNWGQVLCRIGARACLRADASPMAIFDALEKLSTGLAVVSHEFRPEFECPDSASQPESLPPDTLSRLTIRQIEILTLISTGFTVRQVASRLHLSPRTVESHKYQLMRVLDCRCVVELCRFAIRIGLIVP